MVLLCSSSCFFLCWILEFVVGFVLQDNKTVVLLLCFFRARVCAFIIKTQKAASKGRARVF